MKLQWRMNACADNGQSDSIANQSSSGKEALCARNEKRLRETSRVTRNTVCDVVDFISVNQFSVVVHAKNPHFFSPGGEYLTEPTVT